MARSWEEMRVSITDDCSARPATTSPGGTSGSPRRKGSGTRRPSAPGSDQGVTGYQQMLLVMETFGYPDYLLASADDLIEAQYADREPLRPIFEAVLAAAAAIGNVEVHARKTYTTLLTPRRTFAAVRPSTKTRVDLGLRIDGAEPGGRLIDGRAIAGGTVNLRVALSSVDDLDDEAVGFLRRAYDANSLGREFMSRCSWRKDEAGDRHPDWPPRVRDLTIVQLALSADGTAL